MSDEFEQPVFKSTSDFDGTRWVMLKEVRECHLDGNRTNNHVFNLKYATALENQSHRFAHGTILRNEKHPQSKLSFSKANEIRALFKKTPGKYSNSKELAEKFGVSQSTIRNIINGNAWPDKRLRKEHK